MMVAALVAAHVLLAMWAVVGGMGFVASWPWKGVVATVLPRNVEAAADARQR